MLLRLSQIPLEELPLLGSTELESLLASRHVRVTPGMERVTDDPLNELSEEPHLVAFAAGFDAAAPVGVA